MMPGFTRVKLVDPGPVTYLDSSTIHHGLYSMVEGRGVQPNMSTCAYSGWAGSSVMRTICIAQWLYWWTTLAVLNDWCLVTWISFFDLIVAMVVVILLLAKSALVGSWATDSAGSPKSGECQERRWPHGSSSHHGSPILSLEFQDRVYGVVDAHCIEPWFRGRTRFWGELWNQSRKSNAVMDMGGARIRRSAQAFNYLQEFRGWLLHGIFTENDRIYHSGPWW